MVRCAAFNAVVSVHGRGKLGGEMKIADIVDGELITKTLKAGGQGSGRVAGTGVAKQTSELAEKATDKALDSNKQTDHVAARTAHRAARDGWGDVVDTANVRNRGTESAHAGVKKDYHDKMADMHSDCVMHPRS
jgi:hypothetical protein